MDIKAFFKSFWKHFPVWFVVISDIIFVVQMLIDWDDPVYGFAHFGPIVFISALFPLIWALLYFLGDRKANHTVSPAATTTSKCEQEETK